MVYDKLNRKIHVGDIIAIGDYSSTLNIGKVYKIRKNTINFKTYQGELDPNGTYAWSRKGLSLEDLKKPPTAYNGWCTFKRCRERILILKKYKK